MIARVCVQRDVDEATLGLQTQMLDMQATIARLQQELIQCYQAFAQQTQDLQTAKDQLTQTHWQAIR